VLPPGVVRRKFLTYGIEEWPEGKPTEDHLKDDKGFYLFLTLSTDLPINEERCHQNKPVRKDDAEVSSLPRKRMRSSLRRADLSNHSAHTAQERGEFENGDSNIFITISICRFLKEKREIFAQRWCVFLSLFIQDASAHIDVMGSGGDREKACSEHSNRREQLENRGEVRHQHEKKGGI